MEVDNARMYSNILIQFLLEIICYGLGFLEVNGLGFIGISGYKCQGLEFSIYSVQGYGVTHVNALL